MKTHLYTLPIKGAAALAIVATQPTRRVEIAEDDGATAQGIVLFKPDDNFVTGYAIANGKLPVTLGEELARGSGSGTVLGHPIQKDQGGTVTLRAADILFKATSNTATATKIRVTEYD